MPNNDTNLAENFVGHGANYTIAFTGSDLVEASKLVAHFKEQGVLDEPVTRPSIVQCRAPFL